MAMRKRLITLSILALSLSNIPATAQTATYYASYFHGRRTASGVIFNNNANMAAHPSLAFGTRIKVTNRNNGKSVIVKVVDRCRCSLDLSQSAFQSIGALRSGRLPVSIQILN